MSISLRWCRACPCHRKPDATLGMQNSGPPDRSFRSIGLRLLF
jgi:hypothetical protein